MHGARAGPDGVLARPTLVDVEPRVLLVAGTLAVLVLVVAVVAFRFSERETAPPTPEPELPRGVGDVLAVLRSAAVVVDVADAVVRSTPPAHSLGIVRGHEVVHPQLLEMVREVRRDGLTREQELELPRGPLGRGTLVVLARVAALGTLHVLVLVEDRTEARRVEEVRRDFVVNVSHELKTPVGAISLLAETIESAADDPPAVRRFAGRMHREADRLAALVQEIVDLSRLQTASALAEPELVSVDLVIGEAVDRARLAADAKRITLDVGPPCSAKVYGDHDLLVTALRNLVDNAVRYSEQGTRIGIGTQVDGDLVEVAVADQGIGIPAGDLERVFERFYRVDPARSRSTGGTGLGLSIVKHVVANHGGDVTVWSEPDAGSTFTVRLPVASTGEAGPASAPAAAPPARAHGARRSTT
ncbi:ATP-binding protein [Angustibacter speluncae]